MAAGFPTKNNWVAGDVLTASALDDLATTVNYTQYMTPRNAIINSAFDIWQRGTSFSSPASAAYTADRWQLVYDGTGATRTISQQTFTPGTAPVSGYESAYYCRYAQSVAGSAGTYNTFEQHIEDVRSFAGQTVTVSFWAKLAAGASITVGMNQNFGSGGSTQVNAFSSSVTLTTSWARYTVTAAIPAITGKTIGTSSYLSLYFQVALNATYTFDIWGVQVEAGSYANQFMRQGASQQAELALCQRYYQRFTSSATASTFGFGSANTTTNGYVIVHLPVSLRVPSTSLDFSALQVSDGVTNTVVSAIASTIGNGTQQLCTITVASGLTQYRPLFLQQNTLSGYIGFNAEL